jgi:hypothetical protein
MPPRSPRSALGSTGLLACPPQRLAILTDSRPGYTQGALRARGRRQHPHHTQAAAQRCRSDLRRLLRRDASDPARFVDDVTALRQVEEHEDVAERIFGDNEMADRDIIRPGH